MSGWRGGRVAYPLPRAVRLSFILFVFAIPFEPMDLGFLTGLLSVAKVTGALFFGTCLWYRKRCFPRLPKVVWWFFLYWLILFLWAFFLPSEILRTLVVQLITTAQLILLLWVGCSLLRDVSLARTVFLAFAGSCALLAIGNLLGLSGFAEEIVDRGSLRISALGYDLNDLGSTMAIAAIIIVGTLLSTVRRKKWQSAVLVVMLAAVMAVLVRTGSRGGFLALVLGVSIYMIPMASSRRRIAAILFGLTALVLVGIMAARDPGTLERLTKTVESGDTAGRDQILGRAWMMIRERPILGWGPVANTQELGSRLGHERKDTHNLLFYLLTEAGLVGTLPFLKAMWMSAKASWIARTTEFGLVPLSLMASVVLINQSLTWQTHKTMWLVFALSIAAATAAYRRTPVRAVASGARTG